MIYKNYYKILDLETSRVTTDEIKIAYRAAAKKYHPDLNVGDNYAEDRIKDINEAYKTLSEPTAKRKYDRIWNSKFAKKEKAFSGNGEKGAIINMFLGNIERPEEKTTKKTAIKGENIETQISATIEEAFYGLDKKIVLKDVDRKSRTINITIPKGICSGEKIRLIGQGKEGQNGGRNGDLFIKINIHDGNHYRIKGYDLYTDLVLTPWEAALGTRVSVKSIDDETKVYVPKGIQTGEKIKIAGKGYHNGTGSRGDLIAEVKVMVPKRLSKEEKELFEKLKEISKFNPRS